MPSVAVLRCGNRRGPHPRRSDTRPVRIAGHATDGTDELPGTFAPQCRLAVQLSTQANGICERFHRTTQEEFYATAFRKKLYSSLQELQADLDDWLAEYNQTRPHSGKYCYGKTPMQTFLDSVSLAREKILDAVSARAPEPERSPAQRSAGGGAAADAAA
jgi:Integrase core domain